MAETGADIPKEIVKKYGLYIVPMHVQFGDETKDDGTFPSQEVVSYYGRTGNLPKTSGSTPQDFVKIFDEIHAEKPEALILYMAYSSVTTCSYASAVIAAEGRDYIYMIDTKQVSAGQCAAVLQMARWLELHPEAEITEAVEMAKQISENVFMCFVPDTLKFLQAGGRVSNASALIGSLLKIHPLIQIMDGYLKATRKIRGKMQNLIPALVEEYIESEELDLREIFLIRTPGLAEDVIQAAEAAAIKKGAKKVTWISTGGVITCHGGPGAFGVVGYRKYFL